MGLAKQGNAIIVGRGANFFLDPTYGLRVRLVAPLEKRVARVSAAEGRSSGSARSEIEQNDAQQADHHQRTGLGSRHVEGQPQPGDLPEPIGGWVDREERVADDDEQHRETDRDSQPSPADAAFQERPIALIDEPQQALTEALLPGMHTGGELAARFAAPT